MNRVHLFGRLFLGGLLLSVLVAGSPHRADAEPLVYFTLTEVRTGDASMQILLPNMIESTATSVEHRVRGVFGQVKLLRPRIYRDVILIVDGGFATTRAVQIEGVNVKGRELDILVAEMYYSLVFHGVKIVKIPARSRDPIRPDMVRYAAMSVVVPVWEALPPKKAVGGYVLVGKSAIATDEFYQRLNARDQDLSNEIVSAMKTAGPDAIMAVLSMWNQLSMLDTIGPVLSYVKNENMGVKLAAIRALMGKGGDVRVEEALERTILSDPSTDAKSAAVKVLLAAGNRKYEVFSLIDDLKSTNPRTVLNAIEGLVKSNNAAASSALVDVLAHNAVEIREKALFGLLELKNGKALRSVLESQAVSDDMKLQVAMGMTGLSARKDKIYGLSYLVVAGRPEQVIPAAGGLGELKATSGVDALIEVLSDPNPGVRDAAMSALGNIGDTRALGPIGLLAERERRNPEGEKATQVAMKILTSRPLQEVTPFANHEQVAVRRIALMALSSFVSGGRNKQVMGILKDKLNDSNQEIRRAAAYALARIQDESVAATLLTYANSEDEKIRAQVAVAMGWSSNSSVASVLIGFLKDGSPLVQMEAARSLRKQKSREAFETILGMDFARYRNMNVKREIIGAIVALAQPEDSAKVLPIYSEAIYEMDEQIKLYAIEGLSTIREQVAINNLGHLVDDFSEKVQIAAAKALGDKQDPNTSEYLSRALFSAQGKTVKEAVLDAMGVSGQSNLERALQDFIKGETDPDLVAKANAVYDSLLQ